MYHVEIYDSDGNSINSLVQWDTNVYIYIKHPMIKSAYTVHFFNKDSSEALLVESEFENNTLKVKVPNDLLTCSKNIYGYVVVYFSGSETERSLCGFDIAVKKRPKPSDYIYTSDPDYLTVTSLFEKTKNEIISSGDLKLSQLENEYDSYCANIVLEKNELTNYIESQKESLISDATISVINSANDAVIESATSVINTKISEVNTKISEVNQSINNIDNSMISNIKLSNSDNEPLEKNNGAVVIPTATDSQDGLMSTNQVSALNAATNKIVVLKLSGTTDMYGKIDCPSNSVYPIASLSRSYAISGDLNGIRVFNLDVSPLTLAANKTIDFNIVCVKK